MINRTGGVFGKLTVVEDNGGSQLKCKCVCGSLRLYPRDICKQSYRGPTACAECRSHPCEICGKPVYKTNKATCSEKCSRARASARERERYLRVKNTDSWKSTRAEYIATLKKRLESDSVFRAAYSSQRRKYVAKYRENLRSQPDRYEEYLRKHRQRECERLLRPEVRRRMATYYVFWYHMMLDADYQRIYVTPREARRNARKNST